MDRRVNTSHGYRAVHVIVREGSAMIEVQVRTSLQHLWAEVSEKLSDTDDPAIKYGGGSALIRSLLCLSSGFAEVLETVEADFHDARAEALTDAQRRAVDEVEAMLLRSRQALIRILQDMMPPSET